VRILYHHRTQATGAEAVHIAGMARAFEALGHEVVFSGPTEVDPRTAAGRDPFALRRRGGLLTWLSEHAPRAVFELLEIAYNLVARRRNARLLAAHKFDLIYERHAFFLSSSAALAKKHDIPLIVEVNELAGDQRVRATTLLRPLAERADLRLFRGADMIITVSPYLRRRIAALGIDDRKVLVVPNAVDDAQLAAPSGRDRVRAALGLSQALVVGFVGWFVPWHRIELLIAAFAAAAEGRPALRLLLVAEGPLREELLSQAARLGVRERLILTGSIPHAEVPAHFDAMDIAVVPHSNEFRSPIKLFEAMARGCAVVAPATEPITSVVREGETAALFPPEDAAALAAKIARLADDPALRARLGAAARATVAKHHTWRRNAETVLQALPTK
jgi:glycosyltransferase involved in cell wall biosynthesis